MSVESPPPAPERARRPTSRNPGLLGLGIIGVLGVFAAWSFAVPPFDTTWQNMVDDAGFLPFRLAIAWAAWQLSRAPGTADRAALGWRLLAAAFAVSAVSNVLRVVGHAGIDLGDATRLAMAVPQAGLMLGGLYQLARLREERGRAADWFDAGIILLSGFILASYFIAGGSPFSSRHLGPTRWLFLIYLVADHLAVLLTATAWFRRPPGIARDALALLTLGFAVIAIVDLRYDQLVQWERWRNGGVLDLSVAVALTLLVLGLQVQRHHRPGPSAERPAIRQGRHVVAPIAVVAAALPLLQLAWSRAREVPNLAFLVTSVVVLLVLVLVRQHLARVQAAQQARARAAADLRFRSLVQRSSDAIFQIAPDHTIQWASPSAGQLTGTIPSLLTGRRITDLAHPDDRDRVAVFLANASQPFARNAVLRWRLGRGEPWHEVESVVSDLSADEAVRGFVLNTRDVTERVHLEQQLRQAQKLEAVGRLAGGIAHDFNNILAAIITHAQLVRDALPADDDRATDLLEIEQTAQRGAALTRRLLSFGRPEAGELQAQRLSTFVRGMEPMLRRLLVGQVELALDLDPADPWVRTTEGQLEQILMNLAINARDAMPEGGTVHVQTRQTVVRPGDGMASGGVRPGRWAELTVRDAGIGMDPETLSRIFEPFFTTKASGLGTGLGLATVRGIVHALGGTVTADSTRGLGTTMRVFLPLAAAGEIVDEETPAAVPVPATEGQPRILIVDDEAALRRAMERYLARNAYRVVTAGTALEALDKLDALGWEVDLVITDMVMPRMGGREFARRVRARAPGIPILCMSGHVATEEDAEEADAPGEPWSPERLLAKPFPFPEFLRRVREAIGGSAVGA